MPSTFRTYGPFELPPQSDGGRSLIDTWRNNRGLRSGIGVYIVAEKRGSTYLPWYVGKSDRGFGSRLQNHSVFKSLPSHLTHKSVYIFLIARVTTKRHTIIRSKARYIERSDGDTRMERKKLRSVAHLEYELIGTCRVLNSELLNFQLKKFQEGLHVPGYIGDSQAQLDAPSLALSAMLKPGKLKD